MKTFIEKQENGNRKSVLKEYYARYLQEIRGLSDSSVKHYFDALNNISRRLKDKGLCHRKIHYGLKDDRAMMIGKFMIPELQGLLIAA